MKHAAYILEYDNGESYEDHRTEVIAVLLDKDAAAREAGRLNTWMKRKAAMAPEDPDTDLSDDEFSAALEKRNAYFAKLRCPHGADCLRSGAQTGTGLVRNYAVELLR